MGWTRFLSGYYVLNVMSILMWYWVRPLVNQEELLHTDIFGVDMESQLYFCLAVILVLKFLNSATIDVFLSSLFAFCKFGICVILVVTNWKFAVWYICLLLVMFVLFPQPAYRGPTKAENWIGVDFDRHAQLTHLNKEDRKKANQAAFVMFYTQWATNCNSLSPILAQLSVKYASANFRFGKVDIGRAHFLANRYNIDTSSSTKQLPTFILFENGEESARLPQFSTKATIIPCNFTMGEMEKHFQFEQVARSQTSPPETTKPQTKKPQKKGNNKKKRK